MRARYETWVEGLNGDWLISRQRFFGVPFPVWYRARRRRRARLRRPARRRRGPPARRPVERRARRLHRGPARQARRLRRRPRRHGHLGDVVAHAADRVRAGRTTPTSSRARSRWTCARRRTRSSARGCSPRSCASHLEHDALPWRTPRSPAGSSTPTARRCRSRRATSSRRWRLLEQYGSDAVRYWALSGRPGTDTAFDEGQMKVGRRLAIKLLNASKFVLGVIGEATVTRDRRDVGHRARSTARCSPRSPTLVDDATAAFDDYDYARALERTERFFWALLRRLRRAGEGARVRRDGDAAPRRRRRALAHRARRAAAAVRAAPAVRHRRGVVVVAGRLGAPRRRGRDAELARRRGRRTPTRACFAVAADVLGEIRKAKSDGASGRCAPRSSGVVVRDTRRAARRARGGARRRARGRPRAGHVELVEADALAVDVELADPTLTEPGGEHDPATRPRWLDAPRQPRVASASRRASRAGRAHPTLERMRGARRRCSARPQLEYPVVHVTGTNGKTSVARMATALLVAVGLSVGAVHEPAPRAGQRAHGVERRADRRRRRSTRCSRSSPTLEDLLPDAPELLRDPHRGRVSRWFADVAVDVAVVEVGLGGTVGRDQRGRRPGRGRHQREHRPRRVPRPDARRASRREKAGIVKPGRRRSCSARPIPTLAPIFTDAATRRTCSLRDGDFGVAREPRSRSAAASSTSHTPGAGYAERVPPAARRAPGRQRRDRARRGRGVPRPRARPRASSPTAFAHGALAGSARGRRAPAARRARRREQRRRRARALRAALARGVPRRRRGRSWSGCCARRTRTRCSTRSASRRGDRVVCCRPPSPRALDPDEVADAAVELGVEPDAGRRRRRRRATRSRPRSSSSGPDEPGGRHRLALRRRCGRARSCRFTSSGG